MSLVKWIYLAASCGGLALGYGLGNSQRGGEMAEPNLAGDAQQLAKPSKRKRSSSAQDVTRQYWQHLSKSGLSSEQKVQLAVDELMALYSEFSPTQPMADTNELMIYQLMIFEGLNAAEFQLTMDALMAQLASGPIKKCSANFWLQPYSSWAEIDPSAAFHHALVHSQVDQWTRPVNVMNMWAQNDFDAAEAWYIQSCAQGDLSQQMAERLHHELLEGLVHSDLTRAIQRCLKQPESSSDLQRTMRSAIFLRREELQKMILSHDDDTEVEKLLEVAAGLMPEGEFESFLAPFEQLDDDFCVSASSQKSSILDDEFDRSSWIVSAEGIEPELAALEAGELAGYGLMISVVTLLNSSPDEAMVMLDQYGDKLDEVNIIKEQLNRGDVGFSMHLLERIDDPVLQQKLYRKHYQQFVIESPRGAEQWLSRQEADLQSLLGEEGQP